MTPELYTEKLEYAKQKQKELNDFKNKLRDVYIKSNKPCDIGDTVRIISSGGKEYVGEVLSFALFDLKVFVNSLKINSTTTFQTKPPKSLEVIEKAKEVTV